MRIVKAIYLGLNKDFVCVKETHSVSEWRWQVSRYHLEVVLGSWVAI